METTKVFSETLAAYVDPAVRIILLEGGARSSKTFSSIQLLDTICRKAKRPHLISCVSETMPHLRRGAITDFKNILDTDNVWQPNAWHDTNKMYTYGKGKLEFFSADDMRKVLGPARNDLYMNEGINQQWEVYRQLSIRTTGKIIIDYNPAHEFWAHTKLMPRPDCRVIRSTYKDNDMLSPGQIAEIESNMEIDPEWFAVYGEGKLGSKQGLVWKKWDQVYAMPPRTQWEKAFIGLDWGWSNPTAVMLVVLSRGEVYIDQIMYAANMDNPDIAAAIKDEDLQHLEVICDKADPKSISDLKGYGIRAVPSDNKEIKQGIRIANRYVKHYTQRSLGSIDENRKYKYPRDADGNYGDHPIDKHNHAKDAERYVFLNRLSNIPTGGSVTSGRAKKY